MKTKEIEDVIKQLFEGVYSLEQLVREEKAELSLEDNCVPGGFYLVISRTENGGVAIERGEYGRWSEVLILRREHKEY